MFGSDDGRAKPSLFEIVRIDVVGLEQRPKIVCQAILDITVRKPALAAFAPARAPGIPDHQGAGFGADLALVVIADGNDGMAALN